MGLTEIGLTLFLVFFCVLLSWRQNHKLERDLVIGPIRNILQLIFLGYALTWIFQHTSFILSMCVGLVMTFNAALHIQARTKLKYKGMLLDHLLAIVLVIWPLTLFGTWLSKSSSWWEADHFLPLLGMLLASALNSISLGVGQFGLDIRDKKEDILSWIALGATTEEATSPLIAKCLHVAMTPNLNAMLSMGLVSIPGMMTGQIMAGVSPKIAAFNQIILMLLIVCSSYIGTFLGLISSRRRMFNKMGQPCF